MRIFILDNSSSTKKDGGLVLDMEGEEVTAVKTERWLEIVSIAEQHAKWCGQHKKAVPARFYLLNPPCPHDPLEGRDFAAVRPASAAAAEQAAAVAHVMRATEPFGNTPLTCRLRQLRAALPEELGGQPTLALTIVTDGLPTAPGSRFSQDEDKAAFIVELRAWAKTFGCMPVVRLASDCSKVARYYERVKASAGVPVGLVEDLHREAQAAKHAGNGWLAFSPAVHWLREGGVLEGPFGRLTERSLTYPEVVEVVEWLFERHLHAKVPKTFCDQVACELTRAPAVYNGALRRMSPAVDLLALRRTLGVCSKLEGLRLEFEAMASGFARKAPKGVARELKELAEVVAKRLPGERRSSV